MFFLTGFLAVFFFSEAVSACTCVNDKLSKRFRKANAVFVGSLADRELYESPQNVQNYKDGRFVLFVNKAFKGISKEFVAVDMDFTGFTTNCPWLDKFDEDKDYLVFAYEKDLKVRVSCSDTMPLRAAYDSTVKDIGRLDSFWFRTKVRLWPF